MNFQNPAILLSMSSLRAIVSALLITLTLAGCATAVPDGVRPVKPFDINRYAGKWHEIARLDHDFPKKSKGRA
jgi:apolipoprotein D and lipocalin family protein